MSRSMVDKRTDHTRVDTIAGVLRAHPITRIGILLVLFRLAGLAVRYLAQPASSMRDRLALFLPAASFHSGALLAIVALFLICAKLLPSRRRTIAVIACL